MFTSCGGSLKLHTSKICKPSNRILDGWRSGETRRFIFRSLNSWTPKQIDWERRKKAATSCGKSSWWVVKFSHLEKRMGRLEDTLTIVRVRQNAPQRPWMCFAGIDLCRHSVISIIAGRWSKRCGYGTVYDQSIFQPLFFQLYFCTFVYFIYCYLSFIYLAQFFVCKIFINWRIVGTELMGWKCKFDLSE